MGQKKKQESDLNTLRKEVVALQIMRANYQQLVKAHQQAPTVTEDLVPDETKFQVFQSFNQQVSMHNFAELSGCVFSWIEEQCKPGDLQDLVYSILRQMGNSEAERSESPPDPAYQSSR